MKPRRKPLLRKAAHAQDPTRTVLYGVTVGISARTLLADQLEHFVERGYDVHLVTAPDDQLVKADQLSDVHLSAVPMEREISPVRDLVSLGQWVRTLRRIRPDVVNVASPKAALLGMLAARVTGVPQRVYVVWGLRFEGEAGRRRELLIRIERLIMACATDVVVVSESVGQEMIRAGLAPRRPLLLVGEGSSNGVRAPELRAKTDAVDADDIRAELDIAADSFVVGYVGRVTGDKGLETLAHAVRTLSDRGLPVTLLVIGDVEADEVAAMLRDTVPGVIMTGWSDTPWKFFPAMDAFCLPTHREGFPNVVLEASACAVPVVTTRATGARDSVIDGETGLLVDVGDVDGTAAALRRLYDEPGLRGRLGRAAQDRALEAFRPARIWDGLDSIYTGRPSADVRVVGADRRVERRSEALAGEVVR